MHLDHVRVRVKEATEEGLLAVAFQIEGVTKRNIVTNDQIDTGFMLNTVYVESQKASTFDQTWDNRPGAVEDMKAPKPPVGGRYAEVAVVVGAIYAIFQEMLDPFLRPAANEVAQSAGAIAEPVFRRNIRD